MSKMSRMSKICYLDNFEIDQIPVETFKIKIGLVKFCDVYILFMVIHHHVHNKI